MILMERPVELTLEAQREITILNDRRIREAEQKAGRTPNGELSRERPVISKEMMRPVAIED
jgi:hypothetical protein